ncbi:RecQ family ATP-dependent DNA helicase [Polyangium aurulentum]|uniref:RecQ family ATP-dependent DNA helicase n=1 Tax=Polyangium aurulentum TaxID=2567896 RepID=UPI0010AE3FA9|nr:RecQ family ATP-dependent DNA helicase [Polyangium aurulentum]UQA59238.1 RecQ family ATP-dependent DNA helicase [Polyangium aurulentum]
MASAIGAPTRIPAPKDAHAEDALVALARAQFGFTELRAFQREAVSALLRPGGRVLLVAPTGGGKSLCYQLPALALPGTALVVSPLVALMEDQVRRLASRGIPATFIASVLSREENGRRIAGVRRGQYKLVYAAPERLGHEALLDAIAAAGLSLVAVDEAHCIVQWGHDFRPDYLRIGEALARLLPPRAIACTATATREARAEIARRLGWLPRDTVTIMRGFSRPNLHLEVRRVADRREATHETVQALRGALASPGAGIVYAATRKVVEATARALRGAGLDAPVYHAGLGADERARASADFAEGRARLIVATNAFGMGVDRPDVRIVLHAQPPASLEAYYQEVGRAGRDGGAARGLLLVAPADLALRRRLCRLAPDGAPANPVDAARALARLRAMARYVDAKSCRHAFILRHFGDEAGLGERCGRCDVCVLASAPPPERAPDEDAPDTLRDPPRFTDKPHEEQPAPSSSPPRRRAAPIPEGVPAPLYEALCRYRSALARALSVPAYVIAPNRALVEMALLRPATLDELERIHGMGKTRIAAHGEGFLRVLEDHRDDA